MSAHAPKPRLARVLIALLLLAVVGTAVAYLAFPHYRPDRERYPIRGIDASHHQGRIDWPAVADGDVVFVYLKASEGGDHRDRRFAVNWRAARAAGLDVGAYHFFTFCRPGREQARNFLAVVPVEADALPPAVDLEFGGNCARKPDAATLRRELDAFLAEIEPAYGKPALLYVTPEFLATYRDAVPQRALWRRSIVLPPGSFASDIDAPWHLWQFHNRARIDGIHGSVDFNVFGADAAAYARWKRGR